MSEEGSIVPIEAPVLLTLPTGAKILHTRCKWIEDVTPEIKTLAQALQDYLNTHRDDDPRPIAIAAPQFGETIRMFSCIINEGMDPFTVINPELVYEKDKRFADEGCLSIPGKKFTVMRGKITKIRGMLLDGTVRSFKGHDIVAQMFMHELNHLDGITIDSIGRRIIE